LRRRHLSIGADSFSNDPAENRKDLQVAKDLQEFIREWEERYPNEVVHVKEEISTRYEITATQLSFLKQRKAPILIFHNVTMEKGQKSPFPVVTNLLCSRRRCAEAIGTTPEKVAQEMARRIEQGGIPPVVVSKEEAPCKQVRAKIPEEFSFYDLPIVRHHSLDGGPFITAGLLTVVDPDLKTVNSSHHRNHIWEANRAGIQFGPRAHSGVIFRKNEQAGKDTPMAICIGHHPATVMGAQTRMEQGGDHYHAMGGFLGEPLRVVPSETLGEDFLVPADSQFVIEGYAVAGKRASEGPFGEYTEYYSPQRWAPYFIATAITHRKDALYHNIAVGTPDHQLTGVFGIEQAVYQAAKAVVPSVQNVHLPTSGCSRFHVYIQIKKERNHDGREAILSAMNVDQRIKHVFVFDEDIDIFDDRMVLWAIATRSQWDRDVIAVPNLTGSSWDPSGNGSTTAKGGIDCTMPLPLVEPFPPALRTLRPSLPDEVNERINPFSLESIISEEILARVPTASPGDL
jgi:UbiD family decarboxylase